MKKHQQDIPAGHWYTIQKQVCNLIPEHMVANVAEDYGVDERSRMLVGSVGAGRGYAGCHEGHRRSHQDAHTERFHGLDVHTVSHSVWHVQGERQRGFP